ncbi:MAG TPA: outer membrane beta-barrel protein, partial [Sediminibacterium sp.]|nr:outer membrane beta-barrel protein [Sediminibacterium sp.]
LNISLISRFNSQDIKPYTQFYQDFKIGDSVYHNVSVSTRVNIGLENRTGVNISGSLPITSAFVARTNLFFANRHVVNRLSANNVTDGFDGRFNLNLTYEFNKSLVAEAFAIYHTAVNNVQGKQPQFFAYTLAVRKFFMNKKASLGITATNPFSQYIKQQTTVLNAGYYAENLRWVPYQSFGISFSYKFGKLEFKKVKDEDPNNFLNNLSGNN